MKGSLCVRIVSLILSVCVLCSGCSMIGADVENQLIPPQNDVEQNAMQNALNAQLQTQNFVLTYPTGGDYRTPFVVLNQIRKPEVITPTPTVPEKTESNILDGWGLVFYRYTTGNAKTRIHVLRKDEEGVWNTVADIEAHSDVLDGMLARANNWVSDLGKILDPVADKVTLLVISICFYRAGWIPQYMMIAVIIKESIMMLGGLIMLRYKAVAYADTFGKAATTLFSTSIVMALIRELNFSPFLTRICSASTFIFGLSVAFSFVALVHYGRTQFAQRKA